MSASELIKQAKRLSREDRERLLELLLEMDFAQETVAAQSEKVDWSDTFERTRRIFGDQTVPNMILAERESYDY
jgi:hypothetical protein